jgi:uncharacterized protein YjbI with pentapeptide repeats
MNNDLLKEKLERHGKWLREETDGAIADFTNADLTGAHLTDADLSNAYLTRADLTDAHLDGADLTRANLTNADLSNAYLTDAHLDGADLTNADLRKASMRHADLRGANLSNACWPLSPNSFDVKVDSSFLHRLCYHICRLDMGDDAEHAAIKEAIKQYANKSNYVAYNGVIE